MSSIKKITALLLALLICVCMGACDKMPRTKDAQWGFKAGNTEYPIGTYIFPMVNAYTYAYDYLAYELGTDFDPNASILDLQSSFDEAGKMYTCRDYIKKQAEDYMKYMIAIDTLADELGVYPSEEAVNNARSQSSVDWFLGDINGKMSGYAEAYPAKDTYEKYGISYDSFSLATYFSGRKGIKNDAIFSRLYGEGGERAVSDEELGKYFEKDFVSYYFFLVPLYDVTEDSVTQQSVTVPFSDEKTKEYKNTLEFFVSEVKKGASFDNIRPGCMVALGLSEESFNLRIERYDDVTSTLSEEIETVLRNLSEKQAQVVYTGKEESPVAVFIYKDTIADKTKDILSSETDRITLLRDLKNQEYSDYLVSRAEAVQFEVNEKIISKFTPEYIEKVYKQ